MDARQLPLLRAAGADAVLLLAALHPARRLARLVRAALDLGLEPLVEAHDARELDAALATDARVIGINNRDLRTLAIDHELAARLRERIPADRIVVAESGVRDAAILRRWRALGFDAALVGEELMRSGHDPAAVRARVAAFVDAGAGPAPGTDPAVGRPPPIREDLRDHGGRAASRPRSPPACDAIGLNLVPGSPRALSEGEAAALVAAARATSAPGAGPAIVGVFADRPADEVAAIAARLGLDAVQLHGDESPDDLDRIPLPVLKVLHAAAAETQEPPPRPPAQPTRPRPRSSNGPLPTARSRTSRPSSSTRPTRRLLAGPVGAPSTHVAAAVAGRIPVILAGGLTPAQRRDRPARHPRGRGRRLERRRAAAASAGPADQGPLPGRAPRQARPSRPHRSPDGPIRAPPGPSGPPRARRPRPLGRRSRVRGPLRARDAHVRAPRPRGRLHRDPRGARRSGRRCESSAIATSAGRRRSTGPTGSPRELETSGGREPGRLRLYLKREDLDHTGAHKINNALGQALLTRRLGKRRVIAETGAGQHGVATATACALLDLECVVYMGAEDIRRQAPNVLRMRALGTEVREVTSGTRHAQGRRSTRRCATGSRTSRRPTTSSGRPSVRIRSPRSCATSSGSSATRPRSRSATVEGRLPDVAIACVGGGSNAIGLHGALRRRTRDAARRRRGGRGGTRRQARRGARGRLSGRAPRIRARTCSRTTTGR